jgi:mannose/fructose/N-acetylgalactosamine-specific phosphotransferase system component IIC
LDHLFWISSLGALLALDNALFGQFMLSQPLVVGSLFGGILGDWPLGFLAGGLVQMLWLSVIAVGAYLPPDYTIAGGIAVALTLMLVHVGGNALGPSLMLALLLAIPAAPVAGQLDAGVRHLVNNRLARWAEELADRGVYPPLGWIHAGALVPSFIKGLVIYVLWLGPGAWLAKLIFSSLPNRVLAGLELAYWALPAVGFGVAVEMFTRERFSAGVVVLFAATWLLLALWPQGLWLWPPLALAGSAVLAWRKPA